MTERDPDDMPTIRGNDGVVEYCHSIGALGVTPWAVKMALSAKRRKLVPHLHGNQNWFSVNAIHAWLDSMRQREPARYVGANTGKRPEDGAA